MKLICFALLVCTVGAKELSKAEELFRQVYKLERVEQLSAVKALLKLGREEQKLKMVEAVSEKVFTVIKMSRSILESSGYIPGVSSFPEDEKTRDALSNILENTAFFGDVLLRLPDMTEELLRKHTEWITLLEWCINFANQTKLVDSKTDLLFDLMSQEMNFTKRAANYTNPYRKQAPKRPAEVAEEPKKPKKRKTLARGPRLTPGRMSGEL